MLIAHGFEIIEDMYGRDGKTGAAGKLPAAYLLGLYQTNGQVMSFSVVVRETDVLIMPLFAHTRA